MAAQMHRCPSLAALAVAVAGCANVPAQLRPVPVPEHSAVELAEWLQSAERSGVPVADEGRLRTADGVWLAGSDTVRAHLNGSIQTVEVHTRDVARCGSNRGVETGTYRAERRIGGRRLVGGQWYAEWRRVGSAWELREAMLLRPGERLPPVPEECTRPEAEARALARFTASLHGFPFALFTSKPHAGLEGQGSYRYYSTSTERPGAVLSASYRFGRWLTLGGYLGLEPRTRTTYRYTQEYIEWLRSSATLAAVTVGYEGRNVSLDVGPAVVRSRWWWESSTDLGPAPPVERVQPGMVATMRAIQPLAADLGLEVAVQRRFFGGEVVPESDPAVERARSGWMVGLGLALRGMW